MARIGHPSFPRSDLPSDLGKRVRTARQKAGLSRREVAASVPMAPHTLARIERGAQRPLPATLRSIARSIGIPLDRLSPKWGFDDFERSTYGYATPGVAVRALREMRGLSQQDLADAAGVSASTVSRFERALHAPRKITAVGDSEHGAESPNSLAITSNALAEALGFKTAFELTKACAAITVD